jgi:hypothetical protein
MDRREARLSLVPHDEPRIDGAVVRGLSLDLNLAVRAVARGGRLLLKLVQLGLLLLLLLGEKLLRFFRQLFCASFLDLE